MISSFDKSKISNDGYVLVIQGEPNTIGAVLIGIILLPWNI